MDWLSQNWIWIAVAVGVLFFMTRMGGMGGCGMGHSARHGHGEDTNRSPPDGGTGSGASFDPVSRHPMAVGGSAISSIYHGRAYYFESRENRDAFEGAPDKYLTEKSSAGEVIEAETEDAHRQHRQHRRHGC